MGRTGRRISRGLIGVGAVVLVLGGVLYLNNVTSRHRPEQANAGSAPAVDNASVAQAPETTPTTAPSTLPTDGATLAAFNTPEPSTQPSAPTVDASSLITRGLAARDEGNLLAARNLLNEAIQSQQLSPEDLKRVRTSLGELNQTLIFSTKRFADDEFGGTYSVKSGELLKKIADQHEVTWELLCRINGLSDPKKLRAGATIKVLKGPFHAVVNKHDFTMDVYVGAPPGERGSMYVMSYPVGLGLDNSTPTGVWLVDPHKKLKNPTYYSPRGEGVIDAGDPKNPLGERWIGLTGIDGHAVGKMSYGIHGTIEPESIGKQSSMGCIRMMNEDVEKVFDLLVEGKSQVIVKD